MKAELAFLKSINKVVNEKLALLISTIFSGADEKKLLKTFKKYNIAWIFTVFIFFGGYESYLFTTQPAEAVVAEAKDWNDD